MKFELKPYSIYEQGQRQSQADCLYPAHGSATANDRLFILCDGVGDHSKGEMASSAICEAVGNSLRSRWYPMDPLTDIVLQKAIDEAYQTLGTKGDGDAVKPETTLILICLHASGATVAYNGSSRLYHLRPAKGKEPARLMYKTPELSLDDQSTKIVHIIDIAEGDYFYMCSDGMLENTDDVSLLTLITNPKLSNEAKVEKLIENTAGNKDNHSAHLIYIDNVLGIPATKVTDAVSTNGATVVYQVTSPKPKTEIRPMVYAAIALAAVIALIAWMCSGGEPETPSPGDSGDTISNTETLVVPENAVSPSETVPAATTSTPDRSDTLNNAARKNAKSATEENDIDATSASEGITAAKTASDAIVSDKKTDDAKAAESKPEPKPEPKPAENPNTSGSE